MDDGLRTLMDFKYHRHFNASNGADGMSKKKSGKSANDIILPVPPGTIVSNADTGEILGDMVNKGQKLLVAAGGRGGRGNVHFVSSKNNAPEISENGEPGQHFFIKLELKLLADVGLIGFPSSGKSTLLSVVTNAKPKIASYSFTTLNPNLGIVKLDDKRSFVLADLPGLIEGSSSGVGLGIQFLRHIERTNILLHLVDMSPNGRNPYEDYVSIRNELKNYDLNLLNFPEIIVASKMDMPGSKQRLKKFKKDLMANKYKNNVIYPISSISHLNINELMNKTADLLDSTLKNKNDISNVINSQIIEKEKKYKFNYDNKTEYNISRSADGSFIVSGTKIERLVNMINIDHDDGVRYLSYKLRKLGLEDALKSAGAKNGDTVNILNYSFEFFE